MSLDLRSKTRIRDGKDVAHTQIRTLLRSVVNVVATDKMASGDDDDEIMKRVGKRRQRQCLDLMGRK